MRTLTNYRHARRASQRFRYQRLWVTPTVAIFADGTLWQDSGRTTLVTADGQSIGSADDQSGFGHNALQAGAGKPVFKQNIFGTTPAMLFTAASSQYLQTAAFAAALSQPVTVVVASKITDTSASRQIFAALDANNNGLRNAGVAWRMNAGTALNGGTADTNAHVFACLFNGASSRLYVDGGAATASGNAGTTGMDGLTLGATGNAVAFLQGYIYGIIVCNALLTLAQINYWGRRLAAKIGTTWALAS